MDEIPAAGFGYTKSHGVQNPMTLPIISLGVSVAVATDLYRMMPGILEMEAQPLIRRND